MCNRKALTCLVDITVSAHAGAAFISHVVMLREQPCRIRMHGHRHLLCREGNAFTNREVFPFLHPD